MADINNIKPTVGYTVTADIENRKKWLAVQSKMIEDFENGILQDGLPLLNAFKITSMILSSNYVFPELNNMTVETIKNQIGNHVLEDGKREFDSDQLQAFQAIQNYSQFYDQNYESNKSL